MLTSTKPQSLLRHISLSPLFLCVTLALAIGLIYGQFLNNPIVFDDGNFFVEQSHIQYLDKIFSLELRWLPYGSFEWTRQLLGMEIKWHRMGNMLIHIANSIVLFLFLRKLFEVVVGEQVPGASDSTAQAISLPLLAFFGALIFAVHPAAVYGVGYLIQRTILLATLFTLAMCWLFLEGLVRRNSWLLIASAGAYLVAVLSKEHAIMAPALTLVIMFLLHKPSRELIWRVWPTFVLYILIGGFVIYQVKSVNVLGQAYEPNGVDMLSRMTAAHNTFDPRLAYPLSMLTQSFLFFKYLLVWLVPSSAWMSVDMYEEFAAKLWAWPQTFGAICFLIYPIIAIWMLFQRGAKGLFGLAMLWPWLLFVTELSTIRIQDSFVIYRSYLWTPGIFAAMPLLFQTLSAKRAVIALVAISLVMVPLTCVRLITFSHPFLLWDDAARLIKNKDHRPGVERIYHNRGHALFLAKYYDRAEEDLNKALTINPRSGQSYAVRGTIYLQTQRYHQALADFTKSIEVLPTYQAYLGRARVHEVLNNREAAAKDYEVSCLKGSAKGCAKARSYSPAP